jgi:hypothetical protein
VLRFAVLTFTDSAGSRWNLVSSVPGILFVNGVPAVTHSKINCALNLGESSDLAVQTRQSAAFVLTPLFCGSSRKKGGYAPKIKPNFYAFAGGITLGGRQFQFPARLPAPIWDTTRPRLRPS